MDLDNKEPEQSFEDKMRDFVESDLLGDAVVSAEGVEFPIREDVLAAAKAENEAVANAEAPKPIPSEEDATFDALGVEKPQDWDSKQQEDKYKHIQRFATKASQEKKELSEKFDRVAQENEQMRQQLDLIRPHVPDFVEYLKGKQARPEPEGDPDEQITLTRRDLQNLRSQNNEGALRQQFAAYLESDPTYRLIKEGIEFNKVRTTNVDFDKYAEKVKLVKQKYPGISHAEAYSLVRDLSGDPDTKQSQGEASLPNSTGTPAPKSAPAGQQFDRAALDREADSKPNSLGVPPASLRSGRQNKTFDQKLWDATGEVYDEFRKGKVGR